METFVPPRPFVADPGYGRDRQRALATLRDDALDAPIAGLVRTFNRLPHCFTVQSCYGHFVWRQGQAERNLDPLPRLDPGPILYRIAYVFLRLEDSPAGRGLRQELARVPDIAPDCVQFGSADWFREEHPNGYALQVEPARLATRDQATVGHAEALRIEEVRGRFFEELARVARMKAGRNGEART